MNQQRKTIYALRRQILDGRYHREPTEEEAKKHFVPEPVSSSGDWTVETLTPEVKPSIEQMIDELLPKIAERDKQRDAGEDVGDTRPGWRIIRAEMWRQFGALLDLEKVYAKGRDPLVETCVKGVVSSLIQQRERLYDLSHHRMATIIEQALDPDTVEDDWNWDQLEELLSEQFNTKLEFKPGTPDEIAEQVWPKVEERLAEREKDLTRPWLMYFLRHFSLEEIDQQWIEHLKTMEALREGIGLQGYGQMDPKQEYKKAGYTLFSEMMDRIQSNAVTKLFSVQIRREETQIPTLEKEERHLIEQGVADKYEDDETQAARAAARRAPKARTAGDGPTTAPIKRDRPKIGRNDPCPCGSGKKYKKCHGKDEEGGGSSPSGGGMGGTEGKTGKDDRAAARPSE